MTETRRGNVMGARGRNVGDCGPKREGESERERTLRVLREKGYGEVIRNMGEWGIVSERDMGA